MSRGMDPNFLKMQQEVMRHNGLKGAKKTAPDWKRDKKILITVAVVILVLLVVGTVSMVMDIR